MVNHVAVLLAAGVHVLVGTLWYSPLLFQKSWLSALKLTRERLSAEQKRTFATTLTFAALGSLLLAYALAYLLEFTGAHRVTEALTLGFVVWAGIIVTTGSNGVLFENRSLTAFWINAGYELVAVLLMLVLLAVWR
jgi:hypothetical protein